MTTSYYAHISEDHTRAQTIREHLENTAAFAAKFALPFHGEEDAYFAGQWHDIGKYSDAFQRRLRGSAIAVDHSTAGAQEAFRMHRPEIAFVVAGHHGGLPDMGGKMDGPENATLSGRMKRPVEPYERWQEEISLSKAPRRPPAIARDNLSTAFYIRMLFSCLVDADYLDTEAFMNGYAREIEYASMHELYRRLKKYIAKWENPDKELNRRRNDILQACLRCGATAEKGLFTLTVPTGGGKTVSSLAFALSMACAKKMQRVIYVIPYTSIIDQTAGTFQKILGPENVLEHHSGMYYELKEEDATPETRRKALAVENWDAPVVVTTAVQFFESLYANRASRCRKLHNIANSVVIFDEAQSIPTPVLMPCVSAIAQLVQSYGVTAVLCTATQPALGPLFAKLAPELSLQEICPDPAGQYAFFRRTELRLLGELAQDMLGARLAAAEQVLCVVNRRRTAQELYGSLPEEGSYCLTTLLCPATRKQLLKEIRSRLKEGLPCRVVSTSLIEAGVDVDFPIAYRELTGLDSILQTAGRCNREGKSSAAESPVYIFRLEGQKTPKMLEMSVDATNRVLRDCVDPAALEAIRRYFTFYRRLAGEGQLDRWNILPRLRSGEFPFASIGKEFRLIDQATRTIYIPIGHGESLIRRLRNGERNRSLFHQLGQYGVNVYPDHFKALYLADLLEQLDEEILVLRDLSAYDQRTGLAFTVESGNALFQ